MGLDKKKKLIGFLILCCLIAAASLFICIISMKDGILFVLSAVAWGVSVIGIGYSLIELDNLSGLPAQTKKGGAYGKKNFSVH